MNRRTIEGHWMQLMGKARAQWGKLSEDDLELISGDREALIGMLRETYGKSRDEIERAVSAFEARWLSSAAQHDLPADARSDREVHRFQGAIDAPGPEEGLWVSSDPDAPTHYPVEREESPGTPERP